MPDADDLAPRHWGADSELLAEARELERRS